MDPIVSRRIDRTKLAVGKSPDLRSLLGRKRRFDPLGDCVKSGCDVATGATATAYTRIGRCYPKRIKSVRNRPRASLFLKRRH